MKVQAYQCNKCNALHPIENVKGISNIQDAFDIYKSFPYCNPEQTKFHVCFNCVNEFITDPANIQVSHYLADKDEQVKELSYLLKRSVLQAKK
jgi:hypothetical protein